MSRLDQYNAYNRPSNHRYHSPLYTLQLAVDDPATTDEDVPVTLDPLQNDKNPSGSPLDLDNIMNGQNGSCEINADNTVTYTPDPGFNGIDICLYTVCDENELCDEGVSRNN